MVVQGILVTGGAGFIGSHIIDRLTHDDHKVRVLDNLSTGKTDNLAKHIRENSVEFVEGDLSHLKTAKEPCYEPRVS